jgi:hypothetical protein
MLREKTVLDYLKEISCILLQGLRNIIETSVNITEIRFRSRTDAVWIYIEKLSLAWNKHNLPAQLAGAFLENSMGPQLFKK